MQLRGKPGINLNAKVESLLPCLLPDHAHDVGKQRGGTVVAFQNLHAAGLELGHVQNLVDGMKQNPACDIDVACVFAHLVGDVGPERHLVKAYDRVYGRADLVAHAREEALL